MQWVKHMTTPKEAMQLYETYIGNGFASVKRLIDDQAVFWFNDGSFNGLDAIQGAFEKTAESLKEEKYWLTDKNWIADNVCLYQFNWEAVVDGQKTCGCGRGTTVFKELGGEWKIAHEHLSSNP